MIVALLGAYPYEQGFFLGQEYEDAYVYTEYSRYLLYNQDFTVNPLQTKGCVLGSLNNCLMEATYGGHLLVLSSIGYFVSKYADYTPSVLCMINLLVSLASIFLVYSASHVLSGDRRISMVCSLLYATTPAMSLFHTSGLSETLSSATVLFTFLLYLVLVEKPDGLEKRAKPVLWIILILVFSLSLLQKRENLILAFMPFITVAKMMLLGQWERDKAKRMAVFATIVVLTVLAYHYWIDVSNIEKQEGLDINNVTFSLEYFFSLAPVFVRSFFTYKWFFLFSVVALAGMAMLPFTFRTNPLYIYPTMLFTAYFLAYTMHYRSYYHVKYGDVNEYEALRYITNFFPFYCLMAGYAVSQILRVFGMKIEKVKIPVIVLSVILIIYLIHANVILRSEFHKSEQEGRIVPVNETLRHIDQATNAVITDIPLVFQVYASESLVLIDLPSLRTSTNRSVTADMIRSGKSIYYLKHVTGLENRSRERWPEAMAFLDSLQLEEMKGYSARGYELYRVRGVR